MIAGVATARALMAEHVLPAAVAGMSIGAFGAAVACGTLSFADALPLVHLRGELMQTAFPSGYGLAAIEGLDEVHVEVIVDRVRTAAFLSTFPTSMRPSRLSSPEAMLRLIQ